MFLAEVELVEPKKHLWYFMVFPRVFFHGGLRKRELSICFSMAILRGNRVSGGRSKILAHPVCFVYFVIFLCLTKMKSLSHGSGATIRHLL